MYLVSSSSALFLDPFRCWCVSFTTFWQSLICTGSFSWPSSLCSTMKSFGFRSYPVINHKQQKENFHTENVKPMLANIHSQLRPWKTAQWPRLFRIYIQHFAGEETKQLCGFTTSAHESQLSGKGVLGQRWSTEQMAGCAAAHRPEPQKERVSPLSSLGTLLLERHRGKILALVRTAVSPLPPRKIQL